jgi:hypothetical protein
MNIYEQRWMIVTREAMIWGQMNKSTYEIVWAGRHWLEGVNDIDMNKYESIKVFFYFMVVLETNVSTFCDEVAQMLIIDRQFQTKKKRTKDMSMKYVTEFRRRFHFVPTLTRPQGVHRSIERAVSFCWSRKKTSIEWLLLLAGLEISWKHDSWMKIRKAIVIKFIFRFSLFLIDWEFIS